MPQFQLPPLPAHLHFVGIGGIGMSGLARMLRSMGYRVTGSDASPSELVVQLQAEGIGVSIGHGDLGQISRTDVVIRTAAIDDGNPEIVAAVERRIPVIKRAELLGSLSATRTTIAVAGTHGKSTTSAMLTTALMQLGLEPTYAVGAILESTQTNAAFGSGEMMVVEADEYDRSFLELHPRHAIITNIEFDHPDIFESVEDYGDAFVAFAELVENGGSLVVCGDDPGITRLLARIEPAMLLRTRTFGCQKGLNWTLNDGEPGWLITGPDGITTSLELQVPGAHNALNALAAIALMGELGIETGSAASALETYRGIGRRFEIKGEAGGVLVIDDYAHHPTEVAATLVAATDRYPGRRIWAVFQPHTYSRTKALLDDFEDALRHAERRIVLDVYGAREVNDGSITETDMQRLTGTDGNRAHSLPDACDFLAGVVKPGDVVLTLGAGDITRLGPLLLDRIAGNHVN